MHADVTPHFVDWALDASAWLYRHPTLSPVFLHDVALFDPRDLVHRGAMISLDDVAELAAIHIGREHVSHVVVRGPLDDAGVEDGAEVAVVVPLDHEMAEPLRAASVCRVVVGAMIAPFVGHAPGGAAARGAVFDLATILAGFGPFVCVAVADLTSAPRQPGELRDLDPAECFFAQALFERIRRQEAAEVDALLPVRLHARMRSARELVDGLGARVDRVRPRLPPYR